MGTVVNEEEISRMVCYADVAHRQATSGENVGLVVWTDRVMSAMTFIPTLNAIIGQLRAELAISRSKQGGHFDTIIDDHQTHTVCSTCGTILGDHTTPARPADLRQAGRAGEMEARPR